MTAAISSGPGLLLLVFATAAVLLAAGLLVTSWAIGRPEPALAHAAPRPSWRDRLWWLNPLNWRPCEDVTGAGEPEDDRPPLQSQSGVLQPRPDHSPFGDWPEADPAWFENLSEQGDPPDDTRVDARLLPAIREALGYDSLAAWEDAMWAKARRTLPQLALPRPA